MTVTVKTFPTSGEAAAALSSDRSARYLGGGTLVMRALNEGDISVSTVVRATDSALARIEVTNLRVTIGAGVTFARVLAERDLGFLHAPARSIGGPAVRNMGTVGGNLFAPSPYGDFTVALLALDATISMQGGLGTRDVPIEEFLQSRDRQNGSIVLAISCQRPANAEAFRYRKVARIKPKGGSVITLAAHLPVSGGRISGARIALRRPKSVRAPPSARWRGARSIARPSMLPRLRSPRAPRPPTMRWQVPGIAGRSPAFICVACCPVKNKIGIGIIMPKTALQFHHNGREVALFVDGGTNLLVALREIIGDMTPKFGCGQGGCGACSVLIDGELHLSCLTLAETVAGRAVETLDGLKDGPNLHPLQRAFMEHFAAQCGYCTPGMLMAAKALLDRNPTPSRGEVVEAISGNICRCTGYEPIINAVLAAAAGGRARA
jgi:xanthine dehydrogenase iron-sulfur cluster and FAD-binding subunit A